MRGITKLLILFCAGALVSSAQLQPQGAHVDLYFPHLVDGGNATQQWQTTFTFVNVGSLTANVTMWLYNDDGSALTMDLGSGPASILNFTVPANGVQVLKSQLTSPTVIQGWAYAESDVPLQATVAFRAYANNAPVTEISAQPTLPTLTFTTAATPLLGIALANPWNGPTSVNLTLYDSVGNLYAGPVEEQLPPNGHIAFNLSGGVNSPFNLPSNFSGVLYIEGVDPTLPDSFVGWVLGSDGILFSTLPPGDFPWPVSHFDRIWLVWQNVYDAAYSLNTSFLTPAPVSLNILDATRVDAFANGDSEVDVTYALSELIGDDQSELAFAIAHALGHIYQQRNGGQLLYGGDAETDADQWAISILLAANYDPYAGAGTLAKLVMATTNSVLTTSYDNMDTPTAVASLTTRLAGFYAALQTACSISSTCTDYKLVVHPHLPGTAPLLAKPQARPPAVNNTQGRRAMMPPRAVRR